MIQLPCGTTQKIVGVLTMLATLSSASVAQAQSILDRLPQIIDPQKVVQAAVPHCPRSPDPSHVYGYIALIDPATGRTWLPTEQIGEIEQLKDVVNFRVRFRSRSDNSVTTETEITNGQGIMRRIRSSDGRPIGLRYTVRLRGDRNSGTPMAPYSGGSVTISYNPDLWCFDSVVMSSNINRFGYQNLHQHQGPRPLDFPDAARCDNQSNCWDAEGNPI